MSLLTFPSSHADALRYAQSGASERAGGSSFMGAAAETAETWTQYETLLIACLRTGDERAARISLDRLKSRFGADNERVSGLDGLYREAFANSDADLDKILKSYDETLERFPTNIGVRKRRVVVLKALHRPMDAIKALTELLDLVPTDAESWSELADLYCTVSSFPQARFCLEEVLLITPYAWNVHAKLGEVLYMSTDTTGVYASPAERTSALVDAVRHFCRSIELCNDYTRGFYGLSLACSRLLETSTEEVAASDESDSRPSKKTLQSLQSTANANLRRLLATTSKDSSKLTR